MMALKRQAEPEPISGCPRHVAIIMDGNGRWATQRGRPRLFGHHAGAQAGCARSSRPAPISASNT